MKTMHNKEITEKAVIFFILLAMVIIGILYREDFEGQRLAGIIYFGVLSLGLIRLGLFFVTKK